MTFRIILWFRNDLRLHDNYIIQWALNFGKVQNINKEILPMYCFDPRLYKEEES